MAPIFGHFMNSQLYNPIVPLFSPLTRPIIRVAFDAPPRDDNLGAAPYPTIYFPSYFRLVS